MMILFIFVFLQILTSPVLRTSSPNGEEKRKNEIPAAESLKTIFIKESSCSSEINIPTGSQVYVSDNVTLTIDNTLTLQNCEVVLGADATIEVENGDTLNILNSHIHACDTMWQGIYALFADATVIIDEYNSERSVIQDAIDGVRSRNGAKIEATNSDFVNDRTGISIDSGGAYAGAVEGCNFRYDATAGMLPPYAGKRPSAGITVTNTQHWHIPEPNHPANTFTGLNCGINARMSGYTNTSQNGFYVYENIFDSIMSYEPCANTLLCRLNNSTAHHGSAVYLSSEPPLQVAAIGTIPNPPPAVTRSMYMAQVHGGTFTNCNTGVRAIAQHVRVTNTTMKYLTHGIDINRCQYDDITVDNNVIDTVNYGITLNASTGARANVYSNSVTVRDIVPVYIMQATNILTRNVINLNTGVVEDYYGIKLNEADAPSVSARIHHNTIYYGRNGIVLHNVKRGCEVYSNMIYQNGTQNVMGAQNGIYVNGGRNFRIYDNTITGVENNGDVDEFPVTTILTSHDRKQGIMIERGQRYDIYCNQLNYLQRGMLFRQDCNANDSAIHENSFNIYQRGLMLEAAGGVAGWTGGRIGNPNHVNANDWDMASTVSNRAETFNATLTNIPTPITFLYWLTLPSGFQNGSNVSGREINNQPANGGASEAEDCVPISLLRQGNFNDWDYAVAADTMQYAEFEETAKWQGRKNLFAKLSELYAIDSLNDTTMLAYYESNTNETFAKAVRFENVLKGLADTTLANDTIAIYGILDSAYNINNSIEGAAIPQYVTDYKKANQLFLKSFAYGGSALDSNDVEKIETLAFSCPYENGEGVYTARYLYSQLSDTLYHFDDLIFCHEEQSGKRDESETDVITQTETTNNKSLLIVPNPAQNEARVIYVLEKDEIALFALFDMTGRKLTSDITLAEKGVASLNLQMLSNGIYSYRAVGNKGSVFSGKLVITR